MTRPLDRHRPSTSQVWLDVVSAVDYLSRGHRPGLTVYDALEEALRWHVDARVTDYDMRAAVTHRHNLPWDDPDPLHTALERIVHDHPPVTADESPVAAFVHLALAVWVTRMSEQYNASCPWVHPRTRRTIRR
jgi:hypothetical protein